MFGRKRQYLLISLAWLLLCACAQNKSSVPASSILIQPQIINQVISQFADTDLIYLVQDTTAPSLIDFLKINLQGSSVAEMQNNLNQELAKQHPQYAQLGTEIFALNRQSYLIQNIQGSHFTLYRDTLKTRKLPTECCRFKQLQSRPNFGGLVRLSRPVYDSVGHQALLAYALKNSNSKESMSIVLIDLDSLKPRIIYKRKYVTMLNPLECQCNEDLP